MDWTVQDLGAVGEFIGAIAVLVTLGYLAAQVRQNHLSLTADTLNRLQAGFTTVNTMGGSDEKVARVIRLIHQGKVEEMTEDEITQAQLILHAWWNQFQTAASAFQRGVISEHHFGLYANDAMRWFDTPLGKRMVRHERLEPFIEFFRGYAIAPDQVQGNVNKFL